MIIRGSLTELELVGLLRVFNTAQINVQVKQVRLALNFCKNLASVRQTTKHIIIPLQFLAFLLHTIRGRDIKMLKHSQKILALQVVLAIVAFVCYLYLLTLGSYSVLSYVSDRFFGNYYLINLLSGVQQVVFIAFLLLPLLRLPKMLAYTVAITSLVLSSLFWLSHALWGYGPTLSLRGMFGLQSAEYGGNYISVWEILFYIFLVHSVFKFGAKLSVILTLLVVFEFWFLVEAAIRVTLTTTGWNIIPFTLRILLLVLVSRYALGRTIAASSSREKHLLEEGERA